MTEQEWLESSTPTAMLQHLTEIRVSERKARLLACACCRCIWEYLEDPRSRRAVVVAEHFADNRATPRELADARARAVTAARGVSWAAYWATNTKAVGPLVNVFEAAVVAAARQATQQTRLATTWDEVQAESLNEQVELIREVFGNPFRPITVDPNWLGWEGGQVVRLAGAIYEGRTFEQMPILADALEEAGCQDREMLDHCRQGAQHVRGCWVLDLLLGKR